MSATSPHIGIVMGSQSDWPTMRRAADILQKLQVPFETRIVSAHRTPERMFAYAKSAKQRGLKVIIAGAGGAAHLPGMVASLTVLPVLGVPVESRVMKGQDSLLSIVQMPAGVPVATVGVGAARNAGLLAARILGAGSDDAAAAMRERITGFQGELREQALAKGARLQAKVSGAQATGFSA